MRARTQYAARSLTGHSCNEGRTRRLCHIPQQNGPQEIERKALKIMLCSGAAARRGSISQWSRGPSTLSRRCARTLHVCPKNEDPTRFRQALRAGEILREILSSRIRTKSGGACSIGTRKGVSGSGSPRDRNGVENGGRKDATFLRPPW